MGSDKQDNHNRGQKDGARGNAIQDIGREVSRMISGRTEYDKGYDNGRNNRPKK